MDIKEFAEIIKERLEERTGLEVRLVEVTKNNSVILHGINIIVPDTNILPTIYVEPYLEAYKQNLSLEEITEKIINVWEREKEHNHLDVEWFRDFAQAKARVAYKLINSAILEQVSKSPLHSSIFPAIPNCSERKNLNSSRSLSTLKNQFRIH